MLTPMPATDRAERFSLKTTMAMTICRISFTWPMTLKVRLLVALSSVISEKMRAVASDPP